MNVKPGEILIFQASSKFSEGITLNVSKKILGAFPPAVAEIIGKFKKEKKRRTFEYYEKVEGDRLHCGEGEQIIIYDCKAQTVKRGEVVANHSVGGCQQYLEGDLIDPKAGEMVLVQNLFYGKWYLKVFVYFDESSYS